MQVKKGPWAYPVAQPDTSLHSHTAPQFRAVRKPQPDGQSEHKKVPEANAPGTIQVIGRTRRLVAEFETQATGHTVDRVRINPEGCDCEGRRARPENVFASRLM